MHPPIQGSVTPGDSSIDMVFRSSFPGILYLGEDSTTPVDYFNRACKLYLLEVVLNADDAVNNPPTGQAVIHTFYDFDLTAGTKVAIDTVSVAIGALKGTKAVSYALAAGHGVVSYPTQLGTGARVGASSSSKAFGTAA